MDISDDAIVDTINFGLKNLVTPVKNTSLLTLVPLAIEEFDQSLAEFESSSKEGINNILGNDYLRELGVAVQMEALQRHLLTITVRHNQMVIDQLCVMLSKKEHDLLEEPDGDIKVGDVYSSSNLFITAVRSAPESKKKTIPEVVKELRSWKRVVISDASSFFIQLNKRYKKY
jgi:hypothetical protein